MKSKRFLFAIIAVATIAVVAFYVYDNNRFYDAKAKVDNDFSSYTVQDTALSIEVYKSTAKNDPLRSYYAGLQTELDQLYAEYDALIAEEPFLKLSYTDRLLDWNERRTDLYERIEDFLK